jgi:flavin-dependent dehydrogenase
MTGVIRDAVIVGAGPAGSAAAILLARAGWSVAVVEKELFPRRKVCGECLAASNLPLLDELGIGDAFHAAAGPELRRVALMSGEHTIEADLPATSGDDHAWGRALGRETLDVLLLGQARAAGVEVWQPWSVDSMTGGPGDWHVRLRSSHAEDSTTLRARVAIDAHGSWQPLPSARREARRTQRAADLLAFKANFRGADLAAGLLPVLAFDGGYGGMVVADDGLATVACCIRRDRLEALRVAMPGVRAGDAVELYLREQCRGVREALETATRIGPWLAAGPLNPGIRVYERDGAFRIGNAAGEAHPIIGEGMSMALQSAWLLTRHLLARAGTTDGALHRQRDVAVRYAAHWRKTFTPRLLFAAGFAHFAMRPATTAPMIGITGAWPGLLTLGARIKTPWLQGG